MKSKHIAGIVLITIGALTSFRAAMEGNQSMMNLGVGGVFLGIIVLTFSSSDYIKYDAFQAIFRPYFELGCSLVRELELKNNSIYIPPCSVLPEGGVFIPLHENFDIDLTKMDVMFITDAGREREMGLVLPPLGKYLVKMYKEYPEMDLTGAGAAAIENTSYVLRSLGLAKSVSMDNKKDTIKIYIEGVKVDTCSEMCERIACPICNSILLAIAESFQELVMVERIQPNGSFIEITARKIGGVQKWM